MVSQRCAEQRRAGSGPGGVAQRMQGSNLAHIHLARCQRTADPTRIYEDRDLKLLGTAINCRQRQLYSPVADYLRGRTEGGVGGGKDSSSVTQRWARHPSAARRGAVPPRGQAPPRHKEPHRGSRGPRRRHAVARRPTDISAAGSSGQTARHVSRTNIALRSTPSTPCCSWPAGPSEP